MVKIGKMGLSKVTSMGTGGLVGRDSVRHVSSVTTRSSVTVRRLHVIIKVSESRDRVAHGAKRTNTMRIIRAHSDGAT